MIVSLWVLGYMNVYFLIVDTDILKPDVGYLTVIERPGHSSKGSSDQGSSVRWSSGSGSRDLSPDQEKYTEPVSEDEDDDDMLRAPARDEDKRTGLTETQVAEAVAYREQMLRERRKTDVAEGKKPSSNGKSRPDKGDEAATEDAEEDADEATPFLAKSKDRNVNKSSNKKARTVSINPLVPSSAFDETLRNQLQDKKNGLEQPVSPSGMSGDDEEDEETRQALGDDRVLSRDWHAPAGKHIAIPVRIEPKVYFAAERTFLVRFFFVSSRTPWC